MRPGNIATHIFGALRWVKRNSSSLLYHDAPQIVACTGSDDREAMAKILLAEDDDSLRGFLVNALKRAGHVVKDFDEGRSALKALEREVFDLLLTDIVMPGLDGIELARRGAELDPAMKIVFITGFAGVALSGIGPQPAGAKVLSKPFHLRELVDEVERVMAA
jgi:two-component system cell cycle response regulator CpdR